MISNCSKFPCGLTSSGCYDPFCPRNNNAPIPQWGGGPAGPSFPQIQMGCICPPTSEKTCENPGCPRQNHFKCGTSSGTGQSEGATEIERLRSLLRDADDVVIWEHTKARAGFQEEIEAALGIE